jgi:uncharacterized protein involved in exopolysaccharide biosynthesis
LERLHLSPRRIVLVLTVALVAAAAATAVVELGPRMYAAQTTVFVSRVLPASGGVDINTSIADFQTALQLHPVDDEVSKQTGVSSKAIRAGLSVGRLGSSSAVQVSFRSTAATASSSVVTAVVHQALTTLAQQRVDAGNEAVAAARAAATGTLTSLDALNRTLNTNDVTTEYQRHSQNLINLQNQQAVSPSFALIVPIRNEQALVAKLAAAQPRFAELKAASDSAQAALASASQALTDASGRLNAAADPSILTTPVVTVVSRVPELARADGASALAAVCVLLAILVVADGRAARVDVAGTGGPRRDEQADSGGGDGTPPTDGLASDTTPMSTRKSPGAEGAA